MPYGFQTIVIPGDFSYTSTVTFAHALRIALATSQDAPNRRKLSAGGLLVEHAAARQCYRTIIQEDGLSFKAL